jgi:hypothetical protein
MPVQISAVSQKSRCGKDLNILAGARLAHHVRILIGLAAIASPALADGHL